MHIRQMMRGLACGVFLVAAGASMQVARAEGSFEIPAGAHFNPDKLAKIDAFFENEIKQAKIPGADTSKFLELANKAKAGCPVSKLLKTEITLDATLEE